MVYSHGYYVYQQLVVVDLVQRSFLSLYGQTPVVAIQVQEYRRSNRSLSMRRTRAAQNDQIHQARYPEDRTISPYRLGPVVKLIRLHRCM